MGGTGTHISGAFTNFIIYGAWGLIGLSGIYALTTWYRTRQGRIEVLKIDDDIAATNEGIRANTYQSDQFVIQKDSFMLREEFRVVQTFADVVVGLNPGEFDGPDIVYDFSGIDQADLAAAFGRQQSTKSMGTEFALDSNDGDNLQIDFDMEDNEDNAIEENNGESLTKEEIIALSDSFLEGGVQKTLTIDTEVDGHYAHDYDEDNGEDDDFGSDNIPQDEEYDFDQLSAEEILNALNNQHSDMPLPEDVDEFEDDDSSAISNKGSHWGTLSSHVTNASATVAVYDGGDTVKEEEDVQPGSTSAPSTPQPSIHKQLSIETRDLDYDPNAPPISYGQPSSRASQHDFADVEFDFSQMSMTDLMMAIRPSGDVDIGPSNEPHDAEDGNDDELARESISSRASFGLDSEYIEGSPDEDNQIRDNHEEDEENF